jgi:hypothetical protein
MEAVIARRERHRAPSQLIEHYQSCQPAAAGGSDQAADAARTRVQSYDAIASTAAGSSARGCCGSPPMPATTSCGAPSASQPRPCPTPRRGGGAPRPLGRGSGGGGGPLELYRYLDAALRRLPEDQRIAVVLCDVYGMDYGEVADATESALGTVKSRIHRGRLRLRELMAEHRELFLNERRLDR